MSAYLPQIQQLVLLALAGLAEGQVVELICLSGIVVGAHPVVVHRHGLALLVLFCLALQAPPSEQGQHPAC
jgi:hypothetical protein